MKDLSCFSKKVGEMHVLSEENFVSIKTNRLVLTSINQYGYDLLVDHYLRLFGNPENVTMFKNGQAFSLEKVRTFVDKELAKISDEKCCVYFLVTEKKSGSVIGSVKIDYVGNEYGNYGKGHKNAVEIGYLLDKPFWGKGYGTEMAIAAKKYIKSRNIADEIVATVHPENQGSYKILSHCLKQREDQLMYKFNNNPRVFFYKPLKKDASLEIAATVNMQ